MNGVHHECISGNEHEAIFYEKEIFMRIQSDAVPHLNSRNFISFIFFTSSSLNEQANENNRFQRQNEQREQKLLSTQALLCRTAMGTHAHEIAERNISSF
ncbi:hypothetical protein CDAR_294841 [Caerostris darwini]|uniref:Uncharacterized protein n=1 Tax=Caerostris darwini TaxID=1538125 RepID=A0AAV4UKU8_9ARAC|nr:hypothetical protein CDAR_294841 [Caerostris darwini]